MLIDSCTHTISTTEAANTEASEEIAHLESNLGNNSSWSPEIISEFHALAGLLQLYDTKKTCNAEVQFVENKFPEKEILKFHSVSPSISNISQLVTITGLPNFEILKKLEIGVKMLENSNSKILFPAKERIILTLMRINCDVPFALLAWIFQCTPSTCQNYFHNMIPKLARIFKALFFWPTKEQNESSMPNCFKDFANTIAVMDGTEIKVEQSNCLHCKVLTYSYYKGCHTVKFLVVVSPSGLILYISVAYGGRASDKAIFNDCGLISKFTPHRDAVMVDKGFLIDTECKNAGITLIRPPFLEKKR